MSDETPVALVTGAGRGIGAACARALAEEGFRVGVHYRSSEASAREVADKLPDAFTIRADITVPEEVDAMIVGQFDDLLASWTAKAGKDLPRRNGQMRVHRLVKAT